MAIFGKSKKESAKKDVAVSDKPVVAQTPMQVVMLASRTHVLIAPRVTEKAAILSDSGIYVFKVTPKATKPQIALAIRELFKVTPVKVRIVNKKGDSVTTRATGKKGSKASMKKAYVYLKKGDKIELA
jgi:large subunit ribosomal protein L23